MDVLGDIITRGKIDIVKRLWRLFVKIQASVALVFFRFRTGTRFISSATLFCGYLVMTLCWMVEQTYRSEVMISTKETPVGESSAVLLVLAILSFGIVGTVHLFESRRNLRRTDGQGTPRYSGDTGLSLLWIPFQQLVTPLGWGAPVSGLPRWWQWTEYKFQKFIEPLLILLIGILFQQFGYFAFGGYIILCAFCAFMLMVHMEDSYFEMKQESWDAEVLSGVVKHRDTPVERQQGAVVQQAIIRSDPGFEQWKQSAAEQSTFKKSTAQGYYPAA